MPTIWDTHRYGSGSPVWAVSLLGCWSEEISEYKGAAILEEEPTGWYAESSIA